MLTCSWWRHIYYTIVHVNRFFAFKGGLDSKTSILNITSRLVQKARYKYEIVYISRQLQSIYLHFLIFKIIKLSINLTINLSKYN